MFRLSATWLPHSRPTHFAQDSSSCGSAESALRARPPLSPAHRSPGACEASVLCFPSPASPGRGPGASDPQRGRFRRAGLEGQSALGWGLWPWEAWGCVLIGPLGKVGAPCATLVWGQKNKYFFFPACGQFFLDLRKLVCQFWNPFSNNVITV